MRHRKTAVEMAKRCLEVGTSKAWVEILSKEGYKDNVKESIRNVKSVFMRTE